HHVLHRGPLKPVHDAVDAALAPDGVPAGRANFFDQAAKFDLTFHLAPRGMEYPRREMPATIRFVGPLRAEPTGDVRRPGWWADLNGGRPVVHVTQGTLDNLDPDRLLVPTIRGLAGENVLTVASTGGRPVGHLRERLGGRLPENLRVAEFLPYDDLLPRTDVMVTNGGFGGVQRARLHGVPLVVAGATEDKPEVVARVAWSGSGLNLRTGSPSPRRVRRAVRAVLRDRRYAAQADRLRREIQALGDPAEVIAAVLDVRSAVGCPD
ncbi:MAG: glycosyltransferase, partial [Actinomycetes bacterium]